MTTVEILLVAVMISFIVLIIFTIKFICSGCKTLKKINQTTDSIQKQLDHLDHEPKNLLHHTNEILVDIHHKMKHLDPLFRALSNIGEEVECKTAIAKEKSFFSFFKTKSSAWNELEENKVVECLEWALVGINLWKKFKKGR